MNLQIVTLLSILISSGSALAHGMNNHGPNGGYIKMPGAFHTELVDAQKTMRVYLLDMAFKNPEVINSTVHIKYKGKGVEAEYPCTKSSNYFECKKPKDGLKDIKEITVLAVRNNSKGREAVYAVPLKLEGM